MLSRLNSDLFVECVLINNYSAQNAGKTRQAKKKEGEDEIALSVLRCVKFNSTLASHEEFRGADYQWLSNIRKSKGRRGHRKMRHPR